MAPTVKCSITIKAKLTDMFCSEWKDLVFNSSKCLNYRIFKQELKLEPYFDILPDDLSTAFCHFRSLNQRFPIEWGRIIRTARDDRICELCFLNKIGDEFHYMLECSYFEDARRVYLPRILTTACNIDIMCTNDVQELFKVAKFCKVILETFKVIYHNI